MVEYFQVLVPSPALYADIVIISNLDEIQIRSFREFPEYVAFAMFCSPIIQLDHGDEGSCTIEGLMWFMASQTK